MKKLIFALVWIGFFLACSPRLQQTFFTLKDIPQSISPQNTPANSLQVTAENECCRQQSSYIPDTSHLNFMPSKAIRVNVHIMNAADSTRNFSEEAGRAYVKDMLYHCYKDYSSNNRMWLHPPGQDTPVLPTRYHYVLTPQGDDPTDDGIYFHYDDELYYFIRRGKTANMGNRKVIEKYGIGLDSIMNIFMMPHHPDSIASPTYQAHSAGIALGNAIKITGAFALNKKSWMMSRTLNHEVGHNFGLSHAFNKNDGCDDTPPNPRCWSPDDKPGCDTLMSNNVMGYNNNQNAWTPCQIGRIHSHISRLKGKGRKFIIPHWCRLDPKQSITITDHTVWSGEMDLYGHLTIQTGASLEIKCRVSLPKNAKITVAPGAKLILNNARLHNDCGDEWLGIEVQTLGKIKGEVVLMGNARVEDAVYWGEKGNLSAK